MAEIMLAYDENGVLREFDEYKHIVVCRHCTRPYRQHTEDQVPGFREIDHDICPYCHNSNGSSGDVEFYNAALSDEETKRLKKK